MNNIDVYITELNPEKRDLLLRQLLNKITVFPQKQLEIQQRNVSISPLTCAQERLWFFDQLVADSIFCKRIENFRWYKSLSVEALEKSFQEIVRRHEVLRTTFAYRKGQPAQTVLYEQRLSLVLIDLRELTSYKQEQVVRDLSQEDAHVPFELEQGPLFYVRLFHLADNSQLLQIGMHHFIADCWTRNILERELTEIYDAHMAGRPAKLFPLPMQYADYAVWQRKQFQGEVLEKYLLYWSPRLKKIPLLLDLPTDHPRPLVSTFQVEQEHFVISLSLTEALKTLSRRQDVSLFVTLLATFSLLLWRYARQNEFFVGTFVNNRTHVDLENMIGFFANPLAIEVQLSDNLEFLQFMHRIHEEIASAYTYQDIPFELLVEKMDLEQKLYQAPIFQTALVLLESNLSSPLPKSLASQNLPGVNWGMAQLDLNTVMYEVEGCLEGTIEYNAKLYKATTIKQMLKHWLTSLESVVVDPTQCICDVMIMKQDEQQQLLRIWNQTKQEYPAERCVHELFEDQAKRTPDAVALVFEREQLTYQLLNQRANQLAHFLLQKGVKPEKVVGLFLSRSLEMVVGLLAILKAGGIYVPLDPAYPQERLAFLLEDAKITVVLTQASLLESSQHEIGNKEISIVCSDTERENIAQRSNVNVKSGVTSANLAYIIYTSGSSGLPKGVMMDHTGFCNQLVWRQRSLSLTGSQRVLHSMPFTSDPSLWQFFGPLLAGARSIITRPEGYQENEYLVKLIAEEEISILEMVPSMLRVFLQEPQIEQLTSLNHVFCGGEMLPIEVQEKFFSLFSAHLYNQYGPTEAAIDATYWICTHEEDQECIPIGRPIANKQIYLLDERYCPVPIGVAGHVFIGGVGLARGYLNRPELTAEKFLPDPFSSVVGARFYKTGDLARYRSDGAIEFLGRSDNQVKVRGYRIELGEIESVLDQYPDIQKSAVLVREDVTLGQQLVGYVVMKERENVLINSVLRNYVQTRLPAQMVPTIFVLLDVFPLLPNGKIDRRALPAPSINVVDSAANDWIPESELERTVAKIWCEELSLERVSLNDNFFDLGGHSLLMVQVHRKLQKTLNRQITLMDLFKYSTVNALVAYLTVGERVTPQIENSPSLGNDMQIGKNRQKQQFQQRQQKSSNRRS